MLADDEDAAREWLARNRDKPQHDTAYRFAEYNPVVAELTVLSERIGSLITTTAAVGGGDVRVPPRPRPRMAIDRVREQERQAAHRSFVQRLLPNQHD